MEAIALPHVLTWSVIITETYNKTGGIDGCQEYAGENVFVG